MHSKTWCLLLLGLATLYPAQEARGASLAFETGGCEFDPTGHVSFWAVVTTDLPENTCVELEAWLGDWRLEGDSKRAYVLANKETRVTLGPFQKALLPAEYSLRAVVHPQRQDPSVVEYFSTMKDPIVAVAPCRLGTVEEEKAARKKTDDYLTDWLKRLEKFQAELVAAGDGYREKKTWFAPSGAFDAKAFLAWADKAIDTYFALEAERDAYFDSYQAHYRHLVWLSTTVQLLLSVRLIGIDYLVIPVCKRQKLALPPKAVPVEAMFKPPRDSCIEKNAGLFKEAYRALGLYKAPVDFDALILKPEQVPAGLGLARLLPPLEPTAVVNPYVGTPPSREVCDAFEKAVGTRPTFTSTLGAYVICLAEGSPLALGEKKDPPPKPEELPQAQVVVWAIDFSDRVNHWNFTEQMKKYAQEGRNLAVLERDFLVVCIETLDPKAAPAAGALKSHYETVLQGH